MVDYVFAAHGVVGSRNKTIAGHASVGMPGILLTQGGSARNVRKPGTKPSVYTARGGHVTTIGMCGKKAGGKYRAEGEHHIMIRYLFILVGLLLAPGVAVAQFEGEIHTRITAKDGGGFAKVYLSKVGTRSEIDIHSPKRHQVSARPYHVTTLQRFSQPDLVYNVNDERQVYSVIDLKKMPSQTKRVEGDTYTITRLGSDTIAGYACEKARVTSQDQTETDLCVAKDIAGMDAWVAMMEQTMQVKSGMFKALKDAKLEGFPVKMVMRRKGKDSPIVTTEVVRVEAKSLAPSLFEVPSTYKKEDVISSFATPEMAEKMQSFVDKMTPAQRKLYEDMKNRMIGR